MARAHVHLQREGEGVGGAEISETEIVACDSEDLSRVLHVFNQQQL